jgi:predicted aspartyl protease
MPITNYPFTAVNKTSIARAMLPIVIHNPHNGKKMQTWGLIDTGADDCSLPAQFASVLGHDLIKGNVTEINTGNGKTNAYAHTTCIDIFSLKEKRCVYTIHETPVDFMPNLSVVLLGVRSFMSNFVLTMDYPQQRFSLNLP